MNRRSFLQGSATALLASTLPRLASAATNGASTHSSSSIRFEPQPGDWRTFEVVTHIELSAAKGKSRVWLPLPSVHENAWMRPVGNRWSGNAETAQTVTESLYGTQMLFAEWTDTRTPPLLEVSSRFATRRSI